VKRILIIEDDKSQKMVYQYWFSENYLLDLCDNISDAFLLLKKKGYDVILLDLHLGEFESGFSLLEKLKTQNLVKPKVIVVSAYLDSLKELTAKEKENIVWLDKEEATQERLIKEMGLKEDNQQT